MSPRSDMINFGPYTGPSTFNPGSSLYRPGDIGKVWFGTDGKVWKVCKVEDAVTTVGAVVYWSDRAASSVTMTIGNSSQGEVAGVAPVAIAAADDYACIQVGGLASVKAVGTFVDGTPVIADGSTNRVIPKSEDTGAIALGVADTGGGVLSWANPTGVAIIVTRLVVDLTTKASGAGTCDFGTTPTSATTLSANLIDGADMNAAVDMWSNDVDPGTLGKPQQLLAAGKWVTGSKASGNMAGLVGNAYITYVRQTAVNVDRILGIAQGAAAAGLVSMELQLPGGFI